MNPYVLPLVLAMSLPALDAQARHFKVYGYGTPAAGEAELVYWTDYVAKSDVAMDFFGKTGVDRGQLWAHTLEVEYGLTDRLTVAAYADFEQPDGEDFKFVQGRVVAARYRFGEPRARFFDSAVYVEYYLPRAAWQNKAREKLELRLILEKDLNGKTLKLNPKIEKLTSGPDVNEGLEFEYGASLYSPWSGRFQWGLEIYGSIGQLVDIKPRDEQRHYVVPAISWKLTPSLKWNLGSAFGLTDASDDVVIKSILEWEL